MLEAIPPQLITGGGLASLVTLAIWLILTGRIVPRKVHEDRIADKDAHIAYLRQTLGVRDEEVRIRNEQIQKLLTNSDLTVTLLQSIAREARRGDLET